MNPDSKPGGKKLICNWKEDSDGNWDTECGDCFVMTDGKPSENSYKFCPSCGNQLVEETFKYEDEAQ